MDERFEEFKKAVLSVEVNSGLSSIELGFLDKVWEADQNQLNQEELEISFKVWQATQPQWQSIETAPRDGTRLLLWEREGFAFCGFYYPTQAEWVANIAGVSLDWTPTHWMPLPPPPQQ